MKKTFLTLLAVAMLLPAVAQKANVSKARNKTLSEEPDFAAAREAILPALTNDETKDDPKTWEVAAQIGEIEGQTLESQIYMGGDVMAIAQSIGKAQYESAGYFTQAATLAAVPNAKGKPTNAGTLKKSQNALLGYYTAPNNYIIQYGNKLFESRDFEGAYNAFMRWATIPDLPFMQEPKLLAKMPKDTLNYQIKYYAARAKFLDDKHAEAIKICESIKDGLYDQEGVLQLITESYRQMGDTAQFLANLESGMKRFPKSQWFIGTMINHYVFGGKSKEALELVDRIIAEEPQNGQYRFVKGNLLNNLERFDEAFASYQEALDLNVSKELEPEVYSGIGRSFFNHAVKLNDEATYEKDMNRVNQLDAEAKDLYKKALEYFEKVRELNPKDKDNLRTLRQLYYRFQMHDKYEQIGAELAN